MNKTIVLFLLLCCLPAVGSAQPSLRTDGVYTHEFPTSFATVVEVLRFLPDSTVLLDAAEKGVYRQLGPSLHAGNHSPEAVTFFPDGSFSFEQPDFDPRQKLRYVGRLGKKGLTIDIQTIDERKRVLQTKKKLVYSFEVLEGLDERQPQEEEIFVLVEEMPQHPGGSEAEMAFIRTHLQIADDALRESAVQLIVWQFVVEKDGSLSNIAILRTFDATITDQLPEFLSQMPAWIPGRQRGVPVRVRVTRSLRL
ncbi:MAG: hypothetical protein KDC41_10215 [Saprospiraceae bacterium]|nr:hypothetical protein [Saprospiraceae bacterium]